MELNEIDPIGLIRDSYAIDGITIEECRSIFLDWAIKLHQEIDSREAIEILVAQYVKSNPDHPMNSVLLDGQGSSLKTGRRGGWSARVSGMS